MKLKQILVNASVARFKNDSGDLGLKYTHTTERRVHPSVCQYPLNMGIIGEIDLVKEPNALGIIYKETNPINKITIQAVKKPLFFWGGRRKVMNFKTLNWWIIATRASLINPQGAFKTFYQQSLPEMNEGRCATWCPNTGCWTSHCPPEWETQGMLTLPLSTELTQTRELGKVGQPTNL